MARISEDDIRRVREATDLVSLIGERVVLKQKGRDFWGCCPFHNDKTPSFKVDPASQFYHCFGCGEGGNAFQYLMKLEGMEFPDAVRYLAQRANIELTESGGGLPSGKRARLIAVCEETASFYHTQLMRSRSEDADKARAYLAGRGLGGQVPKDWNLGYAPGRGALVKHLKEKGFTYAEMVEADVARTSEDQQGRKRTRDRFYERVIFPIHDLQGRTIAFGGRIIGSGDQSKYINTSDTPIFHKSENLFAIDVAKSAITSKGSTAIVVEGYTDVIAMHQAGFTNTVATLGTALTPQHVKTLSRFAKGGKIIYLFDGDEAGQRAADRASGLIGPVITPEAGTSRVDLMVAVLPGNADPAEYCASAGAEGMQAVLDSAVPLLQFSIDRELSRWDMTVPEQRARALNKAVELLVPIRDSLLAVDYVNDLADRFGVDDVTVRKALDKARVTPVYERGERSQEGQQGSGQETRKARETILIEGDEASMERELLALYASYPKIRDGLATDLLEYPWLYPLHEKVFDALISLDKALDVASTFDQVAQKEPDAITLLTAVSLSYDDGQAKDAADALVRSLRIAGYERQIREGNARLKKPGDMGNEEYDQLFSQVAKLQKELNAFRMSSNK